MTDESGASDTDTLTLAFVNAPPTAEAGSNQQVGRRQEFTLRGAGSDDASGNSLTYAWSQTSGPPVELSDATAATPSFTAPNELGTLAFSLTVSDGEHDSEPDSVTITIRNLPPVADAGTFQEVGHGARVTLDGSGSRDVDGDSLTYEWTQLTGETVSLNDASAAKPSFTAPQKAGALTFRLEVNDGTSSARDTVRVDVTYEPVVASNFDTATLNTRVLYEAKEDAFTGEVRTDVRMQGPNGDLLLDVVCFANGSAAIGFRLLDLERDLGFADQLEVIWRLNDGEVMRRTLSVEFLGTTPAVCFQNAFGGFEFETSWPQVLEGGSLAVRIGYRGVQEDVFDLDAFAKSPVHGNLLNCGNY